MASSNHDKVIANSSCQACGCCGGRGRSDRPEVLVGRRIVWINGNASIGCPVDGIIVSTIGMIPMIPIQINTPRIVTIRCQAGHGGKTSSPIIKIKGINPQENQQSRCLV